MPIREFWKKESIKANSTAYVSGAAGAVGGVAGQILKKIYGINRVIGSASSDEKVSYLKSIGYDEAFNYKKLSPSEALKGAKIDYFFDNVGGTTLDAVLLEMNKGGKIIACGAIELYEMENPAGKRLYFSISL